MRSFEINPSVVLKGERTKCGEIFRDTCGGISVWLACTHCNLVEFFTNFDDFLSHLIIHHTAIKIEPIEPDNDDDNQTETFEPHHHIDADDDNKIQQNNEQSASDAASSTISSGVNEEDFSFSPPPPRAAGEMELICVYCQKPLGKFMKQLCYHMWKVHSYGFPCPMCDRKFPFQHLVVRHLKTHSANRPHECDKCGQFFKQKH